MEARIAIAEYMLNCAREELEKGDAVQASEKLYKAVEECIKALACVEALKNVKSLEERASGGRVFWRELHQNLQELRV